MTVRVEMLDVEGVIESECAQGCTQKSIALSYAFGLRSPRCNEIDWPRINAAIVAKFGVRGLERVKRRAWRLWEGKEQP